MTSTFDLMIAGLRNVAALQVRAAQLYAQSGEHYAAERAQRIAHDAAAKADRLERAAARAT